MELLEMYLRWPRSDLGSGSCPEWGSFQTLHDPSREPRWKVPAPLPSVWGSSGRPDQETILRSRGGRRCLFHYNHDDYNDCNHCLADPRILSWWTETDLRTDSLHQSDTPLGLTWCALLLTRAHPVWKSTSAPLFFCTSGKKTVENLKISHRQLATCQENRIKGQQTVSSAGCKVLASNAGFLLALMPFYCRFRQIKCCYSPSVSVSVPQDKIRGSAIHNAADD